MRNSCFWKECKWEFEKVRLQRNPKFILKWLKYVFAVCYLLSPSKWISGTLKKQAKIETGNLRPYFCIDIYVTAWFVIELAVAIIIGVFHPPVISSQSIASYVFVGLFSYRLFDIFQSWVSQFVLKNRWEAIDVHRSLVLAFVGYIEITIIGTIVRLTFQQSSPLYNSVVTMIANPRIEDASPIQYTQIMFAILFLVVVVQHVVGRLSSK